MPRTTCGSSLTYAVAILIAACCVTRAEEGHSQAPQTPAAVKPAQIDRNGVLILIRSTLTALDQANKTGNYSVLRDLAAPNFAMANNSARLAEIFATQRTQHLDLSGVLVLDPQLTILPEIDTAGRMRFAGFFPSVPTQVNFRLVYEAVDGQWRLGEIGVNLGPSGPVAPVAEPATPVRSPPSPAPAKKTNVQRPKPASPKPQEPPTN